MYSFFLFTVPYDYICGEPKTSETDEAKLQPSMFTHYDEGISNAITSVVFTIAIFSNAHGEVVISILLFVSLLSQN